MLDLVREVASAAPEAAADAARQMHREGIASGSVAKLAAVVADRARKCRDVI